MAGEQEGCGARPRSRLSLRSRVVVASALVQLAVLGVVIYSGVRVMEAKLAERTRLHLEDKKQLLSTALASPLMSADRARVQEILDRARANGAAYVVLFDRKGKVVASSGWDKGRRLPPRRASFKASDDGIVHTELDVTTAGERYGHLLMGVPAAFFSSARNELIRDSFAIGALALLLSTGLMTAVSYWLTRNLTKLSRASARLAAGDLDVRMPVHSGDEVAQLAEAFNTMAEALSSAIQGERNAAKQQLQASTAALRDAQGVQQDYLKQAQDEHARLSSLLGAMNTGILFVSRENRVVYSNPAFRRIWALPEENETLGRTPVELILASASALARPHEQSRYILVPGGAGEDSAYYEIQMADGRLVTQQGHAVNDVHGRAVGYMWLFEDVTHERHTAEQLIQLAERDALTGLYNRHRFNEELARMIADAQRHESRLALLFFDLDDFKYINDTFGHRAGDAMLIRLAGEVAGQVRRNELFSRLGGDEFALLVPEISDDMLRVLAERITASIATVRLQFEGRNLRLTTSLGIAIYPEHADNAEDLIARADMAMYQAKEAGKNAWRIYDSALDSSVEMASRLSWNDRIPHALENGLMRLQFQGIYSACDGSLSHFEALARMCDKDDPARMLMPAQFIPMAEKSGRIVDIDRWVLREAIQILARVEAIPALAVNVSARSFDDPALPRYIATELKRCAVAPERLQVELTETSAVSDLHDAQRFIEALRHIGCRVCLDDFGTGFSSFAYLKHLQADAVKIDGLFIRNLPQDRDNQLFVKAIVAVAKGLDKTTIAECVEDEATLEMLKTFEVDLVQGYHLGKPRSDHPLFRGAAVTDTAEAPLIGSGVSRELQMGSDPSHGVGGT